MIGMLLAERMTRGASLALGAGLLLASLALADGPWGDADDPPSRPLITPRTRQAVQRGLAYLAATQTAEGCWMEKVGRKVNEEYKGTMGRHVGVTALAGLSYMAGGSLPGRGAYGPQVDAALGFVRRQIRQNGFITVDESRMYSHAFATLFLAEAYGSTGDEGLSRDVKRAVRCIVQGQNAVGGWRYLPNAKDSDISISVCQLQALRAARNAGLHVPKDTIDAAVRYVRRSFISGHARYRNGFWYQLGDDGMGAQSRTSFALTAAGVTALASAGFYDGPEVAGGIAYLHEHMPSASRQFTSFDYFYGHYYAVQAMFLRGGADWAHYYPAVRDQILSGQNPDGKWCDLVGPHYATAMATLILQVPYRYLPIFER